MRRLDLVPTTVHCPHFNKPVVAQRNQSIDRLVACESSDECRDQSATERPFPRGCPVFPSLAK
jgi:hypothetical protein